MSPAPVASSALLREHLGPALRVQRAVRRLTLAEVADRAGISAQCLSEVERGMKDPSSEMLAAISAALGLQLRELLVIIVTSLPSVAADRDHPGRRRTPPAPEIRQNLGVVHLGTARGSASSSPPARTSHGRAVLLAA
ncbi:hypothetical protein GCM10022261_21200 [Brevibacterium daeguense]|uniref:HTH cro/C1-type domain-containing protein n=1 Tax=Brevibacterium daeguense TaxID=909936 RepID=A0ABP8EKS8_9MICO|nr:helix-turn-helix transcriptional regulator [Brevibacterium daeguense]